MRTAAGTHLSLVLAFLSALYHLFLCVAVSATFFISTLKKHWSHTKVIRISHAALRQQWQHSCGSSFRHNIIIEYSLSPHSSLYFGRRASSTNKCSCHRHCLVEVYSCLSKDCCLVRLHENNWKFSSIEREREGEREGARGRESERERVCEKKIDTEEERANLFAIECSCISATICTIHFPHLIHRKFLDRVGRLEVNPGWPCFFLCADVDLNLGWHPLNVCHCIIFVPVSKAFNCHIGAQSWNNAKTGWLGEYFVKNIM